MFKSKFFPKASPTMFSTPPSAGGSDYEGPMDKIPGATWKITFGFRALTVNWLGQNTVRLRRSSDDAELDFACDATTGEFPLSTAESWRDAVGAADAFIVTFYNQSGNGQHFTQAFSTSQAKLTTVGNSKPGATNGGGFANSYTATAETSVSTGLTAFAAFHPGFFGQGFLDLSADSTGLIVVEFGGLETFANHNRIILTDDGGTNTTGAAYTAAGGNAIIVTDMGTAAGTTTAHTNNSALTLSTDYSEGGAVESCSLISYQFDLAGTEDPIFCEFLVAEGSLSRTNTRTEMMTYYEVS